MPETAADASEFIGPTRIPIPRDSPTRTGHTAARRTPRPVHHGGGKYVRDEVHINGMESFWALVKRECNGTFRHIEPKRLHRYINEFAGRLEMKALGTVDKTCTIVQNPVGKSPTHGQLVAPGTLCGRP